MRLGLAGGGTDLSPYCDEFGGSVLNATIDMYAHAFIDTNVTGPRAVFDAKDLQIADELNLEKPIDLDGPLMLHRAVYRRVMQDFNGGKSIPVKLTTRSDAPPGSGLGSSSTMVVAMLEAYRQLLGLPLGEYDIAHLAFQIERIDCGLSGGRQDQYAATFGGFNFMEFYADDRVIVNPLRIRRYIINELESSLLLYFTGTSRDSSKIIKDQVQAINKSPTESLAAMHRVKSSSFRIKELLFKADIQGMAEEFQASWMHKKATSNSITNNTIDRIEGVAMQAGAKGLKVSGAGGGGFVMIFVDPEERLKVVRALEQFEGRIHKFRFTDEGAYSWTI